MEEVLNKLKELVKLLEEKNNVADVYKGTLLVQREKLEEKERIVDAKEKRLSALERIYKKYDDFEKEKEALAKSVKENQARIELAKKQEENDAETLVQINKEREELAALKKVLDKQSISIKEKEAKFNKDKAELKALISGETLKGMFK